ncbi:DUF2726 domain-containing protein [Nitratireductor sp. CAU 1489]|uniref:DUF2726 domain-containing protein n=1 Tax=Nitratireductor arenosus TaxID=2682096 RepID=A0A844QFY0_9HYPH|nr:DUF2726 domain-containing protein [Nitratireductor arenosus]MVA96978.1 DUF2726 domain-containing protein [Nitratireductor arenosus]
MPFEIIALVDDSVFPLVIFLGGAFLGVAAERVRANAARRKWREQNGSRWDGTKFSTDGRGAGPLDAADQLRIVIEADFSVQPILNKSEARVFKELDQVVLSCNPSWQVMAQVSLGEILRCRNSKAFSCINSKRVDLLLVDEHCRPRHAVEYQGTGHHRGTAAARDAVKKEALRRAGIGYHEVVAGQTTPSELRRLVERLVDKPKTLTHASAAGARLSA